MHNSQTTVSMHFYYFNDKAGIEITKTVASSFCFHQVMKREFFHPFNNKKPDTNEERWLKKYPSNYSNNGIFYFYMYPFAPEKIKKKHSYTITKDTLFIPPNIFLLSPTISSRKGIMF